MIIIDEAQNIPSEVLRKNLTEKSRQMGNARWYTMVIYTGPNPLYYGRSAMMSHIHKTKRGKAMLQFDDLKTPNHKAYGWHEFLRKHLTEK